VRGAGLRESLAPSLAGAAEVTADRQNVAAAGGRPLVLHVEDDEALRASLRLLLSGAGYRVVSAADGPAALALVRGEHLVPDVLIVDYHLTEDMSGTDVAEALAAALGHAPPTVMLTADAMNIEIPWISGAPFWLVPKPFDPRVLLAGLNALVRFHRDTRAAVG
jgi:DNA-binding response OmpR family regulator